MPIRRLTLRLLSPCATRGRLIGPGLDVPCAVGRTGVRAIKREGDGATPRGVWSARRVTYRGDKVLRPRTLLATSAIRPDDGWCDAVGDRNYNRRVRHPYPASAEHMWRADDLYDVVVVLGHNDRPRIQGGGSAIFMHLARPDWAPTAGCLALSARDLTRVLALVGPGTVIDTRL